MVRRMAGWSIEREAKWKINDEGLIKQGLSREGGR